jgi:catechol 2,3-dioxygenase
MGVTTHDIFGDPAGAQPATPGSYGEAPTGYRLPNATHLGPVRLQVGDLGRSVAYYEATLGMRVLDRSALHATLGTPSEPLVELFQKNGIKPAARRGQLGLYHFAILLPDRPSLGRFVQHLSDFNTPAGAGDHLVSESLYLQDPDNLGIEVYADRPPSTWKRIGRQLMMATDPLDLDGLVREAGGKGWDGMPEGTVIGHLHLHVGDLTQASAFYSDAIGFDRMVWQYPGALFLAAGGYHHHLGTNTWAGPGARAPDADSAQLLEWTIVLPDDKDIDAVAECLISAGHSVGRETASGGETLLIRDPWGTPLRIRRSDL